MRRRYSISSLWTDGRLRGAGILTVASGLSALIAFVSIPFLTTLYSPASYGTFAVVLALVSTFSAVATGRYEMLCVVARHNPAGEQEARAGMLLSLWIATLVGAVGWIVAFVVVLLAGQGMSASDRWCWVLTPLFVWLAAASSIQTLFDTRHAEYRLIAILAVFRSAIVAVGQIALGWVSPTVLALLVPLGLSFLPSALRLGVLVSRGRGDRVISYRSLAKTHHRYPLYQVPAALANIMSGNAILFGLSWAFGPATVGVFSIATRLTGFPASVVSGPVNTVYFREAARVSDDRLLSRRLYTLVCAVLAASGVVVFAFIVVALPLLIGLLGSEWIQARQMVLATIPMGLTMLITAPANSALIAFGRQAQLLVWRLALIVLPPAVVVAAPTMGWTDVTAVLFSSIALLAGTIAYLVWGGWVVAQTSRQPRLTDLRFEPSREPDRSVRNRRS